MKQTRSSVSPAPPQGLLTDLEPMESKEIQAPEIWLNRTQLQLKLQERYGTRPHYATIQSAIRRGMPAERHPLIPGRLLFPWRRIEAWLEREREQSVLSPALRASLSR